MKINEESFSKEKIAKYGISATTLIIIFGLFFVAVFFTHKTNDKKLKNLTQTVIQQKYSNYTCTDSIRINSTLSSSCHIYRIKSSGYSGLYACIMRITTVYGPVSAVLIYDSLKQQTEFINFASDTGFADKNILDITEHSQIDFWKEKTKKLVVKSLEEENRK